MACLLWVQNITCFLMKSLQKYRISCYIGPCLMGADCTYMHHYSDAIWMITQIAKTLGSTSNRHRSDAKCRIGVYSMSIRRSLPSGYATNITAIFSFERLVVLKPVKNHNFSLQALCRDSKGFPAQKICNVKMSLMWYNRHVVTLSL